MSVVFDALGLDVHNASALSIRHNGVDVDLTNRRFYFSVRGVRVPDGVDTTTFRVRVQITFAIEKVLKKDVGNYTLVATNEYGVAETMFKLRVMSMPCIYGDVGI